MHGACTLRPFLQVGRQGDGQYIMQDQPVCCKSSPNVCQQTVLTVCSMCRLVMFCWLSTLVMLSYQSQQASLCYHFDDCRYCTYLITLSMLPQHFTCCTPSAMHMSESILPHYNTNAFCDEGGSTCCWESESARKHHEPQVLPQLCLLQLLLVQSAGSGLAHCHWS